MEKPQANHDPESLTVSHLFLCTVSYFHTIYLCRGREGITSLYICGFFQIQMLNYIRNLPRALRTRKHTLLTVTAQICEAIQWCGRGSRTGLGLRGNHGPRPLVLRGGLSPGAGRVQTGIMMMMIFLLLASTRGYDFLSQSQARKVAYLCSNAGPTRPITICIRDQAQCGLGTSRTPLNRFASLYSYPMFF